MQKIQRDDNSIILLTEIVGAFSDFEKALNRAKSRILQECEEDAEAEVHFFKENHQCTFETNRGHGFITYKAFYMMVE